MYNIYIMGQPISSQQPNGYDDISGDGRRYIDARPSPFAVVYNRDDCMCYSNGLCSVSL